MKTQLIEITKIIRREKGIDIFSFDAFSGERGFPNEAAYSGELFTSSISIPVRRKIERDGALQKVRTKKKKNEERERERNRKKLHVKERKETTDKSFVN